MIPQGNDAMVVEVVQVQDEVAETDAVRAVRCQDKAWSSDCWS
jgi:hypothetical protein